MNKPNTYPRIIKTATLRRSCCFCFGRSGAPLQPSQRAEQRARRRCATLQHNPNAASTRPSTQSAVPSLGAAGRPGRKPVARPCTFPSGMPTQLAASPRWGTAFDRCASYSRRPPSHPPLVRTEPRGSDKAQF